MSAIRPQTGSTKANMGAAMFSHITRLLLLVVVTTLSIASPENHAQASELTDTDAKKFFNNKGCNACHGVDEARIGPSYQIVATRYADASPDTIDKLSKKILYGGAGSWGAVPMISNPGVSQKEARAVARWILGLNKSKHGVQ